MSTHFSFVCPSVDARSDHRCLSLVTGGWAGWTVGNIFWFSVCLPDPCSVLVSLAVGPRRLISVSLVSFARCLPVGSAKGKLQLSLKGRRKDWVLILPPPALPSVILVLAVVMFVVVVVIFIYSQNLCWHTLPLWLQLFLLYPFPLQDWGRSWFSSVANLWELLYLWMVPSALSLTFEIVRLWISLWSTLRVCHPFPVNALIEKMEMLVRCFLTVAVPYPLSAFLAMVLIGELMSAVRNNPKLLVVQ